MWSSYPPWLCATCVHLWSASPIICYRKTVCIMFFWAIYKRLYRLLSVHFYREPQFLLRRDFWKLSPRELEFCTHYPMFAIFCGLMFLIFFRQNRTKSHKIAQNWSVEREKLFAMFCQYANYVYFCTRILKEKLLWKRCVLYVPSIKTGSIVPVHCLYTACTLPVPPGVRKAYRHRSATTKSVLI